MSTYAKFTTGRTWGWLGTLQRDSHPAGIASVGPGRLALTATDPEQFRAAVEDLLTVWEDEGYGFAIRPDPDDDPPLLHLDYVYAFDAPKPYNGGVWIRQPDHIWLPAAEHPDVRAALGHK